MREKSRKLKAESGKQKAESRKRKAESGRQKAESGKLKAEKHHPCLFLCIQNLKFKNQNFQSHVPASR